VFLFFLILWILGFEEIVTFLLEQKGIDVDGQDHEGASALHKATFRGFFGIVDILINFGANIDIQDNAGSSPLHKAAFMGHTDVLQLLLEAGAKVNIQDKCAGTPLMNAIFNGMEGSAQLLLDHKAKNVPDHEGKTPLHFAAGYGFIGCCSLLIHRGVDVNVKDKKGRTPLHLAAFLGSTQTVAYLIERGAKVNVADASGVFPIHYAAYRGNIGAVVTLFRAGAKLGKDKGNTSPIHSASVNGQNHILEYLLHQKGGSVAVNKANKKGMTPLHFASKVENVICQFKPYYFS